MFTFVQRHLCHKYQIEIFCVYYILNCHRTLDTDLQSTARNVSLWTDSMPSLKLLPLPLGLNHGGGKIPRSVGARYVPDHPESIHRCSSSCVQP